MPYHEIPSHDSDPFSDPFSHLETVLERDGEVLERLTETAEPLTVERLMQVDPRFGMLAEEVAQTALQWPTDHSAVGFADDSIARSFSGSEGNQAFIRPIWEHKQEPSKVQDKYNNLFMLLSSDHVYPSEQALQDFMIHKDSMRLSYDTKAYVARAYALLPDFMTALQQATAHVAGMKEWKETLFLGHFDSDEHPGNAALLKATRHAYVLLGQLMTKDDPEIQKALIGMDTDNSVKITDAEVELRS